MMQVVSAWASFAVGRSGGQLLLSGGLHVPLALVVVGHGSRMSCYPEISAKLSVHTPGYHPDNTDKRPVAQCTSLGWWTILGPRHTKSVNFEAQFLGN